MSVRVLLLGFAVLVLAGSAGCRRRADVPPHDVQPEQSPAPLRPRPTPPPPPREAQAVSPSSIAGLYAVRRATQSTTCPTNTPGEVLNTIWVLDLTPNAETLKLSVYGATSFTHFTSAITGPSVQFTGNADTDPTTTITVILSPAGDRQLRGTETISMPTIGGRCIVQRNVTANLLN